MGKILIYLLPAIILRALPLIFRILKFKEISPEEIKRITEKTYPRSYVFLLNLEYAFGFIVSIFIFSIILKPIINIISQYDFNGITGAIFIILTLITLICFIFTIFSIISLKYSNKDFIDLSILKAAKAGFPFEASEIVRMNFVLFVVSIICAAITYVLGVFF